MRPQLLGEWASVGEVHERPPSAAFWATTPEDGCGPSALRRSDQACSHVGVVASYLDYVPSLWLAHQPGGERIVSSGPESFGL